MTSKEADPSGKVSIYTVLPLHGNVFACSNVAFPLDLECGKVLEDKEFIDFGEWFILFVHHL
jgi:hypothetical protein